MEMVRHEKKQMNPPRAAGILVVQRPFNGGGYRGSRELVPAARFTIDCNEEDRSLFDPRGNLMR
jgi:hypothetical protein